MCPRQDNFRRCSRHGWSSRPRASKPFAFVGDGQSHVIAFQYPKGVVSSTTSCLPVPPQLAPISLASRFQVMANRGSRKPKRSVRRQTRDSKALPHRGSRTACSSGSSVKIRTNRTRAGLAKALKRCTAECSFIKARDTRTRARWAKPHFASPGLWLLSRTKGICKNVVVCLYVDQARSGLPVVLP